MEGSGGHDVFYLFMLVNISYREGGGEGGENSNNNRKLNNIRTIS